MVDDIALVACSPLREEPASRREVARSLYHELAMPNDPIERYRYEAERWGMDAESNRAVEFDIPSFNDPGDGAV